MWDVVFSAVVGSSFPKLLGKLAPPRRRSEFDAMPFDELRRRNHWIYKVGFAIAGASLVIPTLFYTIGGAPIQDWRPLCIGLGMAGIFPSLFATLVTLLKGPRRFFEFWRFYELHEKIRLEVLVSMNLGVGILCLLAAAYAYLP